MPLRELRSKPLTSEQKSKGVSMTFIDENARFFRMNDKASASNTTTTDAQRKPFTDLVGEDYYGSSGIRSISDDLPTGHFGKECPEHSTRRKPFTSREILKQKLEGGEFVWSVSDSQSRACTCSKNHTNRTTDTDQGDFNDTSLSDVERGLGESATQNDNRPIHDQKANSKFGRSKLSMKYRDSLKCVHSINNIIMLEKSNNDDTYIDLPNLSAQYPLEEGDGWVGYKYNSDDTANDGSIVASGRILPQYIQRMSSIFSRCIKLDEFEEPPSLEETGQDYGQAGSAISSNPLDNAENQIANPSFLVTDSSGIRSILN
ncbi:uncharacterized protein L201_002289 [Kwoniella dendrophila CBS 6074]|uniref:Uncharacterized protein n=1 Tax=Kwoniella dendrophila CBS 6074 TaxID=1295534 RepID=A0AAX4JPS8_9TREE